MSARGLIVLSEFMDPYLNMGIEGWLYDTFSQERIVLFLWKNSDSIVIGRFQNPWAECDVPEADKAGIPILRRISGGGTVFHDSGNLNFSIITPRGLYDQGRSFSAILTALSGMGILAEIQNKSDIVVRGKKVSGNAFKVSSDKAMHHGTLLVNSDLPRLKRFLTPCIIPVVSKAIKSRPSPVINLSDHRPEIDISEVSSRIRQNFIEEFCPNGAEKIVFTEDSAHTNNGIFTSAVGFRDWSWVFGKTPFFEFAAGSCIIRVEDGVIKRVLTDKGRQILDTLTGRRLDAGTLSAVYEGAREINDLLMGQDYV